MSNEYTRRYPNGRPIAGRLNLLLSLAGHDLGESLLDRVVQGSYNAGGVAASAGTHDGGGAVDLSVSGWSGGRITEVLTVLRKRGLIAWYRHPGQGFDPHIHGIDRGAKDLSVGAADQVRRFDNGENGLASHAPDDGPKVPVPAFNYEAGLKEWDALMTPPKPEPEPKPSKGAVRRFAYKPYNKATKQENRKFPRGSWQRIITGLDPDGAAEAMMTGQFRLRPLDAPGCYVRFVRVYKDGRRDGTGDAWYQWPPTGGLPVTHRHTIGGGRFTVDVEVKVPGTGEFVVWYAYGKIHG